MPPNALKLVSRIWRCFREYYPIVFTNRRSFKINAHTHGQKKLEILYPSALKSFFYASCNLSIFFRGTISKYQFSRSFFFNAFLYIYLSAFQETSYFPHLIDWTCSLNHQFETNIYQHNRILRNKCCKIPYNVPNFHQNSWSHLLCKSQ